MEKYKLILTDPPYSFGNFNRENDKRGARKEYPTQSKEDIYKTARHIKGMMDDNSTMLIWAPDTHLQEMMKFIDEAGFKYITKAFTWVKTNKTYDKIMEAALDWDKKYPIKADQPIMSFYSDDVIKAMRPKIGMGFYTRKQTESCYLAKRGKGIPKISSSVAEVIQARIGVHSKKPIEIYQRIDELFGNDMKRIEVYCREVLAGWHGVGNDISGNDVLVDIDKINKEFIEDLGSNEYGEFIWKNGAINIKDKNGYVEFDKNFYNAKQARKFLLSISIEAKDFLISNYKKGVKDTNE
jgi:N6-adenosine-specific RNA methylase IME4